MTTPPNTGDAELHYKIEYALADSIGQVFGKRTRLTPSGGINRVKLELQISRVEKIIAAHDRALIKTILAEDMPEERYRGAEGSAYYKGLVDGHNGAIRQITTALQKRLDKKQ